MSDLSVAFLWHMHQPIYKNPRTEEYVLPFTRLHGVKGYYDMVRLALEYPQMKMTINLVPSLLKQIEEYASGEARDIFVDLTMKDPKELIPSEKAFIIKNFFMNRWDTQIHPHPRYRELLEKRMEILKKDDMDKFSSIFSDADIGDLQALFNLSWCGYFVKRDFPHIDELIKKGRNFSQDDRASIIDTHFEVMKRLIPLYKKASYEGIVELTTSPYYHPILPLVINTESAKRAMPDAKLPTDFAHPEDAHAQVEMGLSFFAQKIGHRPRGMWPSEGSVSPEVIPIFCDLGIEWIASDEDVLANSHITDKGPKDIYFPYTAVHDGREVSIVFRDKRLSDLISFSYGKNDPKLAATDFIGQIREIAKGRKGKPTLIVVILDGENPWEGYPDGGEGFLRGVYEALSNRDSGIAPATIGDYIKEHPPNRTIDNLHSGSWINHNFGIWIGHPEDNRAWDYLKLTRDFLIKAKETGASEEDLKKAWEGIYAAEGSDWFWWFGDEFHTDVGDEFDSLFREHLSSVFRALKKEPLEILSHPIKGDKRIAETRAPLGFIEPDTNGKIDDFYEWENAGYYEISYSKGSMHGGPKVIECIYFGFSRDSFYVRLDPKESSAFDSGLFVHLYIDTELKKDNIVGGFLITFPLKRGEEKYDLLVFAEKGRYEKIGEFTNIGIEKITELGIPFSALGIGEGRAFRFFFEIRSDGVNISRYPDRGSLETEIPDSDFELQNWSA